ncbi:MAG: Hsp20/alpha crystallin family protein [Haloarculaceae archaeon]
MDDRPDPFDEMERFFDQLTGSGAPVSSDVPVDVVDEGDAFAVVADLPGYDPDDMEVQLGNERRLSISASRETEREETGEDYVRRERERQRVSRSVTLPEPVDESETEASYDNGVLTVRMGKRSGSDGGTDIPVN